MDRNQINDMKKKIEALDLENKHLKKQINAIHYFLVNSRLLESSVNNEIVSDLMPCFKVKNSESEVLVLAFSGMNLRIGMPTFEFMKTLKNQDCSCIFFKDFYQVWYQQGLLGLTDDVYETRNLIQSMIKEINPRYIVSIGVSTGGYAAIMFGILLRINRVLAFSPQSRVGRGIYNQFHSIDSPEIQDFKSRGKYIWDLSKLIGDYSWEQNIPEISVYYGELNSNDKRHAERLARFENVKLCPLAGYKGHNSAGFLKKESRLESVLAEVLKFDDKVSEL